MNAKTQYLQKGSSLLLLIAVLQSKFRRHFKLQGNVFIFLSPPTPHHILSHFTAILKQFSVIASVYLMLLLLHVSHAQQLTRYEVCNHLTAHAPLVVNLSTNNRNSLGPLEHNIPDKCSGVSCAYLLLCNFFVYVCVFFISLEVNKLPWFVLQ